MSNHWILTKDRAQSIISALDVGNMTLKAAKEYYSAYGINIKGNTKARFIKALITEIMSANLATMGPRRSAVVPPEIINE